MLRPLIPKLSICKLGSRGRVMDVIVEKVLTLEWLIEGALFIVLASVIPRISKYIFALLRKYVRRYEARRRRRIKNLRRNTWEMHRLIANERSAFLVMMGSCFFYLILLFVTPLVKVFEASLWVGLLLTSPIYICEIIWINRSDFLKDTIASAKKIA